MSRYAFITAGLLIVSGPAFSQIVFDDSPRPAAPAKSAAVKSDLDKVICRMQDTLGSRLQAHQVCMTKQQWWQYEQDNKRKVEELQDLTPVRSSG